MSGTTLKARKVVKTYDETVEILSNTALELI